MSERPREVARRAAPVEPVTAEIVRRAPTALAPDVTPQLLPAVQRGFKLAQRGALYAAQTEFVQVLRRAAQAKDAAAGSDGHSRFLAAGLRAIDEAEDFVPDGIQLEADLNVQVVASSHRTPVLRDLPQQVPPHDAVVLYHHYAQEQLARAVAGEQAGSMALHGLGKIYARLAARHDDDVQLSRNATTMYAAALAARADNHLAANELGVMLCRGGRAAEAAQLFERAIDSAPSALAYHNLAVAQGKLGMHGQAAANEQESQRLAAWERTTGAVSRRAGVQWVSPEQMSRVAQPGLLTPTAYEAAAPVAETPPAAAIVNGPQKSRWQKTLELAKLLPLPGRSEENAEPAVIQPQTAQPFAPPPRPGETQWQ